MRQNETTEVVGDIKCQTRKLIQSLVHFNTLTVFITKLLQTILIHTYNENNFLNKE